MKTRRAIAALVLGVTASMGVASGTAWAGPDSGIPDIGYETTLVGKTVVTTLQHGTFAVKGDTVDVVDSAGNAVINFPLSLDVAGTTIPLAPLVRDAGAVLEVTPTATVAPQVGTFEVRPVASELENQRAQQAFLSQFSIATAIGSFVGLAIGAVVGCIFGLPLFGVGCLPGIATGATIGAIIGTLVAGGPTLIAAGQELINTLNAPPGTTKWNYAEPK